MGLGVRRQCGVPSQALISAVQDALDPLDSQGQGVGLAPIGHTVTVQGVTGVTVGVSFTLTLEANLTFAQLEQELTQVIQGYFTQLIGGWDSGAYLTLRISQLETRLLDIAGVVDIEGTAFNGVAANLVLGGNEICLLGGVTNGAT